VNLDLSGFFLFYPSLMRRQQLRLDTKRLPYAAVLLNIDTVYAGTRIEESAWHKQTHGGGWDGGGRVGRV
jgi:hypothetical protein